MVDTTWELFRSRPIIHQRLYELYTIKHNQVRMMLDRNYVVDDTEMLILHMDLNTFEHYLNKLPGESYDKLNHGYYNSNNELIYVLYIGRFKTSKSNYLTYEEMLRSIQFITKNITICRHYLLIMEVPPNSKAESAINFTDVFIERFLFNDLLYNPLNNFLVPKHELVSDKDKKDILERNRLNLNDLPGISYEDPIVRYYGAVPGQLFRIYRKILVNETTIDEYITYRVVTTTPMTKSTKKTKIK